MCSNKRTKRSLPWRVLSCQSLLSAPMGKVHLCVSRLYSFNARSITLIRYELCLRSYVRWDFEYIYAPMPRLLDDYLPWNTQESRAINICMILDSYLLLYTCFIVPRMRMKQIRMTNSLSSSDCFAFSCVWYPPVAKTNDEMVRNDSWNMARNARELGSCSDPVWNNGAVFKI